MEKESSNLTSLLLLGAIVFAIFYFINKSKNNTISNEGELLEDEMDEIEASGDQEVQEEMDKLSDKMYEFNYKVGEEGKEAGTVTGRDSQSSSKGEFDNYHPHGQLAPLDVGRISKPLSDQKDYGNGVFSYHDRKFKVRTPEELEKMQDSDQYLPKQIHKDWFDVEPLRKSKKIRGTHLIHPKVWHGVNTVGGSLRNASYDLRGNVPVPKINVAPWNNSTMDPDTNIMGICQPV
jgi:hypothetical protein